ncbi:hypothetical protein AWM70_00095 [Paenibacillus yonginensis]|uniref:Uncharacterized protein n=1 Tax=Paenibacillus yonginensis TaxID=1462996 RepID=A0A1B1MVH3_9BACL|nr:hypothetical protein [Paenibacillus yonginensis]ANS73180.1 hypothetical protein AWM70_00095 [Paenibacillus yonginensis]
MTKEKKIDLLNSMFVTEYDCSGGVLDYCLIENKPDHIEKLLKIAVPKAEIDKAISKDGKEINISGFVFSYSEAEWYQNEEFLGYTP